jgi:hypothetical protein
MLTELPREELPDAMLRSQRTAQVTSFCRERDDTGNIFQAQIAVSPPVKGILGS